MLMILVIKKARSGGWWWWDEEWIYWVRVKCLRWPEAGSLFKFLFFLWVFFGKHAKMRQDVEEEYFSCPLFPPSQWWDGTRIKGGRRFRFKPCGLWSRCCRWSPTKQQEKYQSDTKTYRRRQHESEDRETHRMWRKHDKRINFWCFETPLFYPEGGTKRRRPELDALRCMLWWCTSWWWWWRVVFGIVLWCSYKSWCTCTRFRLPDSSRDASTPHFSSFHSLIFFLWCSISCSIHPLIITSIQMVLASFLCLIICAIIVSIPSIICRIWFNPPFFSWKECFYLPVVILVSDRTRW